MLARVLGVFVVVVLACCLLPASERVELDRQVGERSEAGLTVRVVDHLAAVRSVSGERVELWAQAPDLTVELTSPVPAVALRLDVLNCVPGSQLTVDELTVPSSPVDGRLASCRFELPPRERSIVRIAPPDSREGGTFFFAVLSDVQRAIGEVNEIFARMNADPALRFVVSTGDLTNLGERRELVAFQRELEMLAIPLYSTVGNHEMGAEPKHWHELFGPFNVHFRFRGAAFSLVDSGNATIDPEVYGWLEDWLGDARDRVHVVLTHIPPLDPVGLRGGAFRHRKEGAKFMQRLADGRADVLFLGHIHSYYAFSIAGIPTYISGGGGAIEEKLDGLSRHYLRVEVSDTRVESVGMVRID